ncbi:MAG: 16S rRNA (guanine(966)-N(2))-methyltransferase RsmD [Verrucomicrobia bacterium]|nr:16S rRNA (guanine(966)-N(2))-methyltransferase RsmD [Verrucomicrobiota bacterium]
MLRIIAGEAGGQHLYSPPDGLRPTMDRVRAALFSSLGERVVGARVLDLFAGTGAMGLEALSRGASSCLFVELRKGNVRCIERNLEKTRLGQDRRTPVLLQDAIAFAEHRVPENSFDLIFADPPYYDPGKQDIDFAGRLLRSERLRRALDPAGLFVLEQNPLASAPVPEHWELLKQKRYGITEISYLAPR